MGKFLTVAQLVAKAIVVGVVFTASTHYLLNKAANSKDEKSNKR